MEVVRHQFANTCWLREGPISVAGGGCITPAAETRPRLFPCYATKGGVWGRGARGPRTWRLRGYELKALKTRLWAARFSFAAIATSPVTMLCGELVFLVNSMGEETAEREQIATRSG